MRCEGVGQVEELFFGELALRRTIRDQSDSLGTLQSTCARQQAPDLRILLVPDPAFFFRERPQAARYGIDKEVVQDVVLVKGGDHIALCRLALGKLAFELGEPPFLQPLDLPLHAHQSAGLLRSITHASISP